MSAFILLTNQFSAAHIGYGGCELVANVGVTQLKAGSRPARASASKPPWSLTRVVHNCVLRILGNASRVDQT